MLDNPTVADERINRMDWRRWLPASGIVFVALIIIGVVIVSGSTPDEGASAEKISSFYNDNDVRQYIAAFLLAASAPFLVFFAATLAENYWRRGTSRVWEFVLLAGAGVSAAAITATAFIHFAVTAAANENVAGDAIRALNALDATSWVLFNSAFGVLMLGAAGVLLTKSAAQRWMGWVALVIGIAMFIPFADFFALLLMGLWLIAESVLLLRSSEPAEAASAPAIA